MMWCDPGYVFAYIFFSKSETLLEQIIWWYNMHDRTEAYVDSNQKQFGIFLFFKILKTNQG